MSDQSRKNREYGFSTRAIHEAYDPNDHLGALTPPIFMTSTFAFETAEDGGDMFRGEKDGYIYGRTKNPTQTVLEKRIANLERAEAGLAVGSGMAATSCVVLSLLSAGDEIVIDHTLYGNTFAHLTQTLPRFGIIVKITDFTNIKEVERTISKNTKMVFFETPANPNMRLIDIESTAEIVHSVGGLVVIDNTFATPVLQRPISMGADIVVHSATKYLGGHADIIGGIVLSSAEIITTCRQHGLRWITGATLSPFNCFLMLRGLKTLELRMERHSQSALKVAKLLESHSNVDTVSYPGLETSPQFDLAQRQMNGYGGLISFEVNGGLNAGLAMMNKLQVITRAVSLGDTETLIQHPASMTHAVYGDEERAKHGISDGLLRLSIGLENVEDILEDIDNALNDVH